METLSGATGWKEIPLTHWIVVPFSIEEVCAWITKLVSMDDRFCWIDESRTGAPVTWSPQMTELSFKSSLEVLSTLRFSAARL